LYSHSRVEVAYDESVVQAPLKALLIDVGGTLVDDATWIERAEYEALMISRLDEAFGVRHPWFEHVATYRFVEAEPLTWEQRTLEVVAASLAEQGYRASADDLERICRACAAPLSQVVKLSSGALQAVRVIHGTGVRMAVCSNTLWRNDADSRRDWEELGFGDYFDMYVTSHDTGFAKPHPAMFERALAALEVRPSEAAMIGDRPELDLAGARSAGLRSIWMRPPDFDGDPDPEANVVVSRWSEVPPVVQAWTRG
jgi:FMN phosphatase YigB (HAD superfamily)